MTEEAIGEGKAPSGCRHCGKAIATRDNPVAALCEACVRQLADGAGANRVLESIAAPLLLMQGYPRQVVTGNRRALALFGKSLSEVEGQRGGQVFDCIHSFTEAGCGKDANCEGCSIKTAIVDTFESAQPHQHVSRELSVRKAGLVKTFPIQVSTQKVGDLALVRIERYAVREYPESGE